MDVGQHYTCSLCHHFSATSMGGVLRHIGAVHAHEPHFHIVCGINGCPRPYSSYQSFRKHLRRKHQECLATSGHEEVALNGDRLASEPHDDDEPLLHAGALMTQEQSKLHTAMFLLKTKEVNGVSQAALNELVEDVSSLIELTLDTVKANVDSVLSRNGINTEEMHSLNEIFQNEQLRNPFRGLHSEFVQKRAFKDLFGLVEPVARKLGASLKRRIRKSRRRFELCGEFAYDIPLLLSLKQLLSNEFILCEVMRGHQRSDGLIRDYCDATAYQSHPLFSVNHRALQIMLYYDDLEACNPIGSRAKKHKIGIFYYTLGNISPEHRSSTKAIQLLTVVKHSVLRSYGIDKVLQPFMDDIHALEEEDGVSFNIHGSNYNFRGTISLVSADNLAAWDLGGYKTLALALCKCQFCMAIAEDMKAKFLSEDFQPRTRATHANQCADLGGPLHDHIATYGLQRESILNSSKYFHVTEGLSPDIMHDILEGCLQYETKEVLKYLLQERNLLSLDGLNNRIDNFPYCYADATNKPMPIAATSLSSADHSLKQSASQMWCLARLLPLMIGELVPEQDTHWENFNLMLMITDYCFAPITSEEVVPYPQGPYQRAP